MVEKVVQCTQNPLLSWHSPTVHDSGAPSFAEVAEKTLMPQHSCQERAWAGRSLQAPLPAYLASRDSTNINQQG